MLIDVREPEELSEHGVVPGAINIPVRYCYLELWRKKNIPA